MLRLLWLLPMSLGKCYICTQINNSRRKRQNENVSICPLDGTKKKAKIDHFQHVSQTKQAKNTIFAQYPDNDHCATTALRILTIIKTSNVCPTCLGNDNYPYVHTFNECKSVGSSRCYGCFEGNCRNSSCPVSRLVGGICYTCSLPDICHSKNNKMGKNCKNPPLLAREICHVLFKKSHYSLFLRSLNIMLLPTTFADFMKLIQPSPKESGSAEKKYFIAKAVLYYNELFKAVEI